MGNSTDQGRREFLKTSSMAAAAAGALMSRSAFADGKEEIRVGLVGCGGRGSGAALNTLEADPAVKIVAMADVFEDKLTGSHERIAKKYPDRIDVPAERRFIGFDAFQRLLELDDLTYVMFATPPFFRPDHVTAAVEAGKNVFIEKPVAVDAQGIRKVMKAAELAAQKGLAIVAGAQRRHQDNYLEMTKRVADGAIGDVVGGQVYWNMSQLWYVEPKSDSSPMENMLRDWVNWSWLSGDHIVEQHVHQMDVMNWVLGAPKSCVGMGARHRRPTGNQFDCFAVDFDYGDGVHIASYARQINGCANRVDEAFVGTKGMAAPQQITGENAWRFRRPRKPVSPYVQEHIDLIASIREGKPLNEGKQIATSTLMAIMGRQSAYTGKMITWEEMLSDDTTLGFDPIGWDSQFASVEVPVPGGANRKPRT